MLDGFGFFLLLAGGFVLGTLARFIVPGEQKLSWAETTIVGVAGAGVGSIIMNLFTGADVFDFDLRGVFAAAVGSVVVLGVFIYVRRRLGGTEPESTVEALIAAGENDRVEFKQTARHNVHTNAKDARLELVIAKTVAGFLNSDGGTLLIGVADDGKVVGLDNDLQHVKQEDTDRFQLWLSDLLLHTLGKTALAGISVGFPQVEGKTIARVDVEPSPRPVFLDEPGGQRSADFYVRMGNSTRKLLTDEVLEYERSHWS